MSSSRIHPSLSGRPGWARWLATDVVLILLFAVIGHASHYSEVTPRGALATALPFLSAYVLTGLASTAWRRPGSPLRAGLPLWLGTVAGGLLIRVLIGETAALAFQIVAVVTLGVFLVVPRLSVSLVQRWRSSPSASVSPSPSKHQGVLK